MRQLSYVSLTLFIFFVMGCQSQPLPGTKGTVPKFKIAKKPIIQSQSKTNIGSRTKRNSLCKTDTVKFNRMLLQAKVPKPYKPPTYTVTSNKNISKDLSYYQKYRKRFGTPKQIKKIISHSPTLLRLQQQAYMEHLKKLNKQYRGVILRKKQREIKIKIFGMTAEQLSKLENP